MYLCATNSCCGILELSNVICKDETKDFSELFAKQLATKFNEEGGPYQLIWYATPETKWTRELIATMIEDGWEASDWHRAPGHSLEEPLVFLTYDAGALAPIWAEFVAAYLFNAVGETDEDGDWPDYDADTDGGADEEW